MGNAVHLLLSALVVGGAAFVDLFQQSRAKKRENAAVWFAAAAYALSFAVDVLVGSGVKLNAEQAVFALLEPLFRMF